MSCAARTVVLHGDPAQHGLLTGLEKLAPAVSSTAHSPECRLAAADHFVNEVILALGRHGDDAADPLATPRLIAVEMISRCFVKPVLALEKLLPSLSSSLLEDCSGVL